MNDDWNKEQDDVEEALDFAHEYFRYMWSLVREMGRR